VSSWGVEDGVAIGRLLAHEGDICPKRLPASETERQNARNKMQMDANLFTVSQCLPCLWPAKQFYVDACAFPSNLVRGDEQVTNSWPETRSPN